MCFLQLPVSADDFYLLFLKNIISSSLHTSISPSCFCWPCKRKTWSLILTIPFANFYSSISFQCFSFCIETVCICLAAFPSSLIEVSDNLIDENKNLKFEGVLATFVHCAWSLSVIPQEETRNKYNCKLDCFHVSLFYGFLIEMLLCCHFRSNCNFNQGCNFSLLLCFMNALLLWPLCDSLAYPDF